MKHFHTFVISPYLHARWDGGTEFALLGFKDLGWIQRGYFTNPDVVTFEDAEASMINYRNALIKKENAE